MSVDICKRLSSSKNCLTNKSFLCHPKNLPSQHTAFGGVLGGNFFFRQCTTGYMLLQTHILSYPERDKVNELFFFFISHFLGKSWFLQIQQYVGRMCWWWTKNSLPTHRLLFCWSIAILLKDFVCLTYAIKKLYTATAEKLEFSL